MEPKKRGWVFWIIATLFTFVWIIPILASILTSIKSIDELRMGKYWTFPETIALNNYVEAFVTAKMGVYFWNSILITVPTVLAVAFLSSLNGYVLGKLRFRGRESLSIGFMAGMLIPFQVLLIPVFYISSQVLNTYDTRIGVILFHIAFQLAFASFFMRNFVKAIPDGMIEAARVDGCNEWTIYWKVVLPVMRPALAAVCTLLFTWIWNDYLWGLVLLRSDELKPITLGLDNLKGRWESAYHLQSAGAIIAAIPPLVIFTFLQKHFIKGLTMGSIKG